MIANFYIVSESFIQNSSFLKEEIEQRIEHLAEDYNYIRIHKDYNEFFVNDDIFNIPFLRDLTIQELLYDINKKKYIDRDARNALGQIIEKSKETSLNIEEIKELLSFVDENCCHGLIAFYEIEGIDNKKQMVYDRQNWFDFRRYYLGLFPKNSDFFIEECKIYFPNLFFHEGNKNSIKSILSDCPIKIIYHLSALNDEFKDSQKVSLANNANRQQVLEHFSRNAKLDVIASLEGNPDKKPAFSFYFAIDNLGGEEQKVCCEPHIKLPYKDKDDGSYSTDRRIYFHEGISNIAKGNILIGHIGDHL